MKKYILAPHVYVSTLGQDAILLDLAQQCKGRQYVLIKGGAQFFSTLLTDSPVPVFSNQEFDKGVAVCVQAGWLLEEPVRITSIPSHTIRRQANWLPLRLEAILLLRHIAQAIASNAFLPLVLSLMALPTLPRDVPEQDPRIPPIIRAVREASRLFREPKTCLHQSLTICQMLRTRGISVQVAIRFQQDPLQGHMIVVDGERIISWKPGLTSITTLDHFLSATRLLFHSGEMDVHYRQERR